MELDNSSGCVVAMVVVIALLADVRRDLRRLVRGRSVVLVGILSWFLLEGITLSDVLQQFDQQIYDFSILCVFLAAMGFLVGYHSTTGAKVFDPVAARLRQLDDPDLLWRVVLVCSTLGVAPIAYYSGLNLVQLINDILGLRESWGGSIGRAQYGGFRDAMLMLESFVLGAGPFAAILLLDRRVSVLRKSVCVGVVIWPILRAYGSGTRSSLITALLPVLAVMYFKLSPKVQRMLLIGGLLCLPTVYYFMAAMVASRNSGKFDWESGAKVNYVGSEMLQELAYVVVNVPVHSDYQWGYSYYVQLVNPIPRFLWPGKPTLDSGSLLSQLKGAVDKTGQVYMTTAPSLIGEMYWNFGLFGIAALSTFGGWLVRGWDRLCDSHSDSLCTMIFYCMGLSVLFIQGRSLSMNMCYGMLFLYVGVWLVTKLMGKKQPLQHATAMQYLEPGAGSRR